MIAPIEVLLHECRGHVRQIALGVRAHPRLGQRVVVQIRGVQLHALLERFDADGFGKHDGERIRLLAGRAPSAPDADGVRRQLLGDERWNDLLAHVVPGQIVSEERGHVDEERVEKARVLRGMRLEVADVGTEAVDADRAHALRQTADQADAFVSAQVEAAGAMEVVEQFGELTLTGLTVV